MKKMASKTLFRTLYEGLGCSSKLLKAPNCQYVVRTQTSNLSTHSSNDVQEPPQDSLLKATSKVSRTEGRVGQTTNMVIGGTVTDDATNEWIDSYQLVSSYLTTRRFTAIGSGGDDFVHAMVVAVESALQQPIPQCQVKRKASSGGKYISVNIEIVQFMSRKQVQAAYNAMRSDDRMKYVF